MVQKLAAQGLVDASPVRPDRADAMTASAARRRSSAATASSRRGWSRVRLRVGRGARRGRGPRARDQRPAARGHRRAARPAAVRSRTAMRFRMPPATSIASPSCCSPTAAPGHTGRVLRVSDRDPALLRAVEAAGVAVGADGDGGGCRDPPHRGAPTCAARGRGRRGLAQRLSTAASAGGRPRRYGRSRGSAPSRAAAARPSRTASARRRVLADAPRRALRPRGRG